MGLRFMILGSKLSLVRSGFMEAHKLGWSSMKKGLCGECLAVYEECEVFLRMRGNVESDECKRVSENDFFYPRPQPSATTLDTASGKPMVVPLQTPKEETKNQKQHHGRMIIVPPPSHALVSKPKRQSLFDKKLSTHSIKPLSWAVWLGEEEEGDAF
ncbi:hypothetical protein E2542_SST24944 [Spatholobus suberectus]|nr:hypothetical protein E2542_SST24944 [Spatholobus suberectus]